MLERFAMWVIALLLLEAGMVAAFSPSSTRFPIPSSALAAAVGKQQGSTNNRNRRRPKAKKITIAQLQEELRRNPSLLQSEAEGTKRRAPKTKRTRRRVANPQQTYVYAHQRKKVEGQTGESPVPVQETVLQEIRERFGSIVEHCDPVVDPNSLPKILGKIRVSEDTGSGAYAYLMDKPAGWAILGGAAKQKGAQKSQQAGGNNNSPKASSGRQQSTKSQGSHSKVRIVSVDGKHKEDLEWNEEDILAAMTPEEQAEWQLWKGDDNVSPVRAKKVVDDVDLFDFGNFYDGFDAISELSKAERMEAGIENDDYDPNADIDMNFSEEDILAQLTQEEIEEMGLARPKVQKDINPLNEEDLSPSALENVKRIRQRLTENTKTVSLEPASRPSLVAWLKNELYEQEDIRIRGGNFWTALAGAKDVDDSGLVLLCPRSCKTQVFVDNAEYVAVVGNGNFLAPTSKYGSAIPKEFIQTEVVARVRRGRTEDPVQVIQMRIPEVPSSCNAIINHVQTQFQDGIRGDANAHPLDRRASRRLIHCNSLAVSSLLVDESLEFQSHPFPDDIAQFSNRREGQSFKRGSFLGREALLDNPETTAYREINGAADGHPGWTVDRYGKWLLVQHDKQEYEGPLPSIHDGNTMGVYYLPAQADRSSMGSNEYTRPVLLEGKKAPEFIEVKENGIKYLVKLSGELSTGLFLDQRLQRAWLARHCNENTRVLNCFAHCGAFSVAAASAGAATVSLDLNKKWLDRVKPQFEANDIPFDERHDCIFGDCFEWLSKLAKRGEKYDIVILDPPSSSIGKKRRWSVKNDMADLVALAAPLVKKGGYLWTTTNSASLPPLKFAKMCQSGLHSAGQSAAKLERVQSMPQDFPTIGPQPVKNLVWKLPP